MSDMTNKISIFEFGEISEEQIGTTDFESIRDSILEDNGSDEPKNILTLIYKKGRQLIRANSYVGIICFKDGNIIEILPKIGRVTEEGKSRMLLEQMLSTSLDIPFKSYSDSNQTTIDRNPFEFFINAFIEKVDRLLNEGLTSMYFDVQRNETALKGRLNFSENIRYNHSHKERVFVEYQIFGNDTPANRLIRTTVDLLFTITTVPSNRSNLNRLKSELDSIPRSSDIDGDFDSVVIDRNMRSYPVILSWCDVFLRNKSLSVFHGDAVAFSFLFPMEKLYESYVAELIYRRYWGEYTVKKQGGKYLFDRPQRRFLLKPDVILKSRENPSEKYIVDTKWKLITSQKDISQQDIYQMYAYSKKFGTNKTILLYPGDNKNGWIYSDGEVMIKVEFIDMENVDMNNVQEFELDISS